MARRAAIAPDAVGLPGQHLLTLLVPEEEKAAKAMRDLLEDQEKFVTAAGVLNQSTM